MWRLLQRHLQTLKRVRRYNAKQQKKFFADCDRGVIDCCCEIARNILNSNVPLSDRQFKALRRQKRNLRNLAKIKSSVKQKRKILQTGGFLGLILGPLVSAIAGGIGSLIAKKISR